MSEIGSSSRFQWSLLRAGQFTPSQDEVPTRTSDISVQAGPIRFALGPAQEARVLLPLSSKERVRKLSSASSLHIKELNSVLDGKLIRLLDITCLHKELENVFAEVVDEVLLRIHMGTGVPDAVRSTLEDFRALLLFPSTKNKPIETIIGLVGELLILSELQKISPEGWRCWTGPHGARHDFRAGNRAIEVKSTRSTANSLVTIQSHEQLSEPQGGKLHLIRLLLEPTPGGMLSVSELFRAAAQNCTESGKLREVLQKLECNDPDAPEWNHIHFSLEGEEMFEVTEGFPRITKANFTKGTLPVGVQGISYQVDLNQARQFLIPLNQKRSIYEELIACLSLS